MGVILPREIQKKVQKRARKHGVSEHEYVRKAVEYALTTDEHLDEEMRVWDEISLHDFRQFAKAHKL